MAGESPRFCRAQSGTARRESHAMIVMTARRKIRGVGGTMNLVVLLMILLLLFGGGGYYVGGPLVGGGIVGVLLLVLIVSLLTGKRLG